MHVTTSPSDADVREAGFVLMGEPLAVDLANTIKLAVEPTIDLLADEARNAVFWSLEEDRLPGPASVPSLSESLALREAVHSLLTSVERGDPPEASAVSYVNEVARRTRVTTELVPAGSSVAARACWQADDAADIALSAVAQSAIDLLAGADADRLRVCAAAHCSMMFVATNSKRRWCTADGCGNRERVARHSRQQQGSPAHDASAASPSPSQRPPLFVLLASVLVGPSVWYPVAEVLRGMGRDVLVVPPENAPVPATAEEASDLYNRFIPTDRPVVLVPHSNAGNFVPALVGSRDITAVVFVDAVIPVTSGTQYLAPPEFLAEIEQLADADEMLPVWTRWFPEEDVAELFPHPSVRSDVESRQSTVSAHFLRSSLVIESGWDTVPAGYLAFGSTYPDEQDRAAAYDWAVVTLDGRHLHMVVDPQRVALEILALTRASSRS